MEAQAAFTVTGNAITAATVYAFGYTVQEAYDRALTKLSRYARTTSKALALEGYEHRIERELDGDSFEFRFDFK